MKEDELYTPINEDCDTWHKEPNEEDPLVDGNSQVSGEKADKKGFFLSLIILLGSIPALIGAWCWPALVIGKICIHVINSEKVFSVVL